MSPVCSQPSTIVSAVFSGCLVVALHDQVAAHADLAGLAARQDLVLVVHELDADQRIRSADRRQPLVVGELAADEVLLGPQVWRCRRALRSGHSRRAITGPKTSIACFSFSTDIGAAP